MTPAFVRAYEARPEVRSSGVPHQHLTDARGVFQHGDRRSRWPQQNQLPVQGRISREYQVDWTRLDTSGSTQLDSADRRLGASDLRKSPMHAQPGPGSAAAMVCTVEEQEQRVTAPLEKVATLVLGIHQQLAEDSVEEVAQLLGAFPAPAGQPLGEWGEAGDVEQQQASIDDSVGRPLTQRRPTRAAAEARTPSGPGPPGAPPAGGRWRP